VHACVLPAVLLTSFDMAHHLWLQHMYDFVKSYLPTLEQFTSTLKHKSADVKKLVHASRYAVGGVTDTCC